MLFPLAILVAHLSLADSEKQDLMKPKKYHGVPEISFCNASITPLIVNSYTLQPDNIESNENVTLTVNAVLTEVVQSGSIDVVAKLDRITVYKKDLDLCTEVKKGNYSCPLNATAYNLQQLIQIPQIPVHGHMDVNVQITDQNNTQLLCMDIKCRV
mmetsp:Transcript_75266/g.119657  ORF Transcript_75266/g.119657 Transcript_75266/m.119657 type:complete len:156 (+) Transcript_75266:96-563(+)